MTKLFNTNSYFVVSFLLESITYGNCTCFQKIANTSLMAAMMTNAMAIVNCPEEAKSMAAKP